MPLLTAAELDQVYGFTPRGTPVGKPTGELPLVLEPSFWEDEIEAPVLRRNDAFLKPHSAGSSHLALERAAGWEALCGSSDEVPQESDCTDAAALRIFERDAERTFMTSGHRASMIGALKQFWPENRDYHQGLGYVYSFLRLSLPEPAVLRILLRLNRSPRFLQGYWFAAPRAYVRDAMVYARLVAEHFPEVSALLATAGVAAEAYVSKWFVGLCLHVLPFRALFAFYEQLLAEGSLALFKFSLSLVRHTQDRLLACPPTDASTIFAILRLDPSVFPNADPIFDEIVARACDWDLTDARIDELRAEERAKLEIKMERVLAAEQKLKAEDEDSEIEFSDDEEEEDPEERLKRLAAAN